MDEIRRVTVLLLRAPFTRRAWRDARFCAIGAITGVVLRRATGERVTAPTRWRGCCWATTRRGRD